MTTINFKVKVTEIDRVTGFNEFESDLVGMKSWNLSDDEIEKLENGLSVKLISPNGRRSISIKKLFI